MTNISCTKKIKTFTLIVIALFALLTLQSAYADVYSEWSYNKILTFDTVYSDTQVNFNITYGIGDNGLDFNSQEDFDDLRFVDSETGDSLSAWNQTTVNSDYVNVWLKLGTSERVTLYYGNPSVESVWSQDDVFIDVIDGVVGAWNMDEANAADPVVDYSGNGNDGIPTGTTVVDGKYLGTKCRNFNGSSSINIPADTSIGVGASFTMEGWVYPTSANAYEFWIGKRLYATDIFYILQLGDGISKLERRFDGSDTYFDLAQVGYNLNAWNHIVFLKNGDSIVGYVNNVASDSVATVGDLSNVTNYMVGMQNDGSYGFNGKVAGLRFYSTALNSTQIATLYNYYPDVALEEGKVLVRVWVEEMPVPVFGTESASQYATKGFVFATVIIGVLLLFIIGLPVLLLTWRRHR